MRAKIEGFIIEICDVCGDAIHHPEDEVLGSHDPLEVGRVRDKLKSMGVESELTDSLDDIGFFIHRECLDNEDITGRVAGNIALVQRAMEAQL